MTLVNLPSLHTGQQKVKDEAKQFNFLMAGRGWRKTSLGVEIVGSHALDGGDAMVFAPLESQWLRVWDGLKKGLPPDRFQFHRTDQRINFPNGNMVEFQSLDKPNTGRSGSPTLILIDEAPLLPEGVYDDIIRPMAFKMNAVIWAMGTFSGRGWFTAKQDLALKPEYQHNFASWRIPGLGAKVVFDTEGDAKLIRTPHPYENPNYGWDKLLEYFHEAKASGPTALRAFRVEVLCELLELEGSAFRNVESVCCLPPINQPGRWDGWYKGGVDIGKEHDFTVITVLDRYTMRQVYQDRFTKCSWETIYSRIAYAMQQYPGEWDVDAIGEGSSVPEAMAQRGLTINGTKWQVNEKAAHYDHLADLIEMSQIQLFDTPENKGELQAMYKEKSKSGQWLYLTLPGYHDDIPASFARMTKGVYPQNLIKAEMPLPEAVYAGETSFFYQNPIW